MVSVRDTVVNEMDIVPGLMGIIVPHKNYNYIPTNCGELDEKRDRVPGKRKIRVNYLFW